MELHLRLGPRQSCCVLKCRRIPTFVHTSQRRARLCRHGPECDANRRPGRHANTPAQREDWIKYSSDPIGQRPCVHDRNWRANALSAAQEARPVGFELQPADRFSIGDAQMRRPKFGFRGVRFRRVARIAPKSSIFGLDEQLCEGRVSDICALGPQSKFGVGCDLDVARRPPALEMETRRTSASSSAETSTSSVVVRVPSRRAISTRSSLKSTAHSSG